MQNKLISKAAGFLAEKRRHRVWTKVVSALGCIVVFCTTYALILPAITLENGTQGEASAVAVTEYAVTLQSTQEDTVQQLSFPSDEHLLLTASDSALDGYQWLIYDPSEESWMQVVGSGTGSSCEVSYGMLSEMLDSSGAARLRLEAVKGESKYYSPELSISMTDPVPASDGEDADDAIAALSLDEEYGIATLSLEEYGISPQGTDDESNDDANNPDGSSSSGTLPEQQPAKAPAVRVSYTALTEGETAPSRDKYSYTDTTNDDGTTTYNRPTDQAEVSFAAGYQAYVQYSEVQKDDSPYTIGYNAKLTDAEIKALEDNFTAEQVNALNSDSISDAGFSDNDWIPVKALTLPDTITDNITYEVGCKALTVKYTVRHWRQVSEDGEVYGTLGTDGKTYIPNETEKLDALAGSQIPANLAKVYNANAANDDDKNSEYKGYTAQPYYIVTVAGDNSTVVDIYYNYTRYNVRVTYQYLDESSDKNGLQATVPWTATFSASGETGSYVLTLTKLDGYQAYVKKSDITSLNDIGYQAGVSYSTIENGENITLVKDSCDATTAYYTEEDNVRTETAAYKSAEDDTLIPVNQLTLPETITGDLTYTVYFQPIKVKYTVQHSFQQLDGTYVIDEKQTTKKWEFVGKLLATETAAYDGYTMVPYAREEVTEDMTVTVKYDRNYYKMVFNLDGGSGTTDLYVQFGTEISSEKLGEPKKTGYTFVGFVTLESDTNGGVRYVKGQAGGYVQSLEELEESGDLTNCKVETLSLYSKTVMKITPNEGTSSIFDGYYVEVTTFNGEPRVAKLANPANDADTPEVTESTDDAAGNTVLTLRDNGETTSDGAAIPSAMPAQNEYYLAIYETGETSYKIEIWRQKTDLESYNYYWSTTMSVPTGTEVSLYNAPDGKGNYTTYTDIDDAVSARLDAWIAEYDEKTDEESQTVVAELTELKNYFHVNANVKGTIAEATVEGDGSTVLRIYLDRNEYTLRFYYARKATNGNTYAFASSNGSFSFSTGNIADCSWGDLSTTPTRIYSQSAPTLNVSSKLTNKTETIGDYTYYCLDLTAAYGTDISALWPQAGSITMADKTTTYSLISWGSQFNSRYQKDIVGTDGEPNIFPFYAVMDQYMVDHYDTDKSAYVATTADNGGIANSFAIYASTNTLYYWDYEFYYEALNAELEDENNTDEVVYVEEIKTKAEDGDSLYSEPYGSEQNYLGSVITANDGEDGAVGYLRKEPMTVTTTGARDGYDMLGPSYQPGAARTGFEKPKMVVTELKPYVTENGTATSYYCGIDSSGKVVPITATRTTSGKYYTYPVVNPDTGNPTGDTAQAVHVLQLYYTRERYDVIFDNGYNGTKTVTVPYGETLYDYKVVPEAVIGADEDGASIQEEEQPLQDVQPLYPLSLGSTMVTAADGTVSQETYYSFTGTWYTSLDEYHQGVAGTEYYFGTPVTVTDSSDNSYTVYTQTDANGQTTATYYKAADGQYYTGSESGDTFTLGDPVTLTAAQLNTLKVSYDPNSYVTMGLHDIQIYAEFQPNTYTATYYWNLPAGANPESLDSATDVPDSAQYGKAYAQETFKYGSKLNGVDDPSYGSYEFIGWFYVNTNSTAGGSLGGTGGASGPTGGNTGLGSDLPQFSKYYDLSVTSDSEAAQGTTLTVNRGTKVTLTANITDKQNNNAEVAEIPNGYTLTWTVNDEDKGNDNTLTFTPTGAGTYSVTATLTNGKDGTDGTENDTATARFQIVVENEIPLTLTASNAVINTGGTLTLTATVDISKLDATDSIDNYRMAWDAGGGTVEYNSTPVISEDKTTATYTATVSFANAGSYTVKANLTENSSDAVVSTANTSITAGQETRVSFDTTSFLTGDVQLYAKWNEVVYIPYTTHYVTPLVTTVEDKECYVLVEPNADGTQKVTTVPTTNASADDLKAYGVMVPIADDVTAQRIAGTTVTLTPKTYTELWDHRNLDVGSSLEDFFAAEGTADELKAFWKEYSKLFEADGVLANYRDALTTMLKSSYQHEAEPDPYYFPWEYSASLKLDIAADPASMTHTFIYTKDGPIDYTVKCVYMYQDENGSVQELVLSNVTDKTYKSIVTVTAPTFEGYTLLAARDETAPEYTVTRALIASVAISNDMMAGPGDPDFDDFGPGNGPPLDDSEITIPESNAIPQSNLITFYYTPSNTAGTYRINHHIQQPDGSYKLYSYITADGTTGTLYKAEKINIAGYTYNADVKNTDGLTHLQGYLTSKPEGADENAYVLEYGKNDLDMYYDAIPVTVNKTWLSVDAEDRFPVKMQVYVARTVTNADGTTTTTAKLYEGAALTLTADNAQESDKSIWTGTLYLPNMDYWAAQAEKDGVTDVKPNEFHYILVETEADETSEGDTSGGDTSGGDTSGGDSSGEATGSGTTEHIPCNVLYQVGNSDTSSEETVTLDGENGAKVTGGQIPLTTTTSDDGTTTVTTGTVNVTNYPAVELPESGGPGTYLYYTFGGLLLAAGGLMYGFRLRRKGERRSKG